MVIAGTGVHKCCCRKNYVNNTYIELYKKKANLRPPQSGDLSLNEVMDHELSPYPPSLFQAKNQLRQPDKPHSRDALKKYLKIHSDGAGLLEYVPEVEHYVLDGGSLLHRLKWAEGSTYSSIADDSCLHLGARRATRGAYF